MSFQQILNSILGVYQPVTQTVDEVTTVVPGMAGVDWSYVLGGLLLIVFVWSVLRVVGGILSAIFR